MSSKILRLYKSLHNEYGNVVTSVKWRSKRSQEKRFEIIKNITKIKSQDKIIDVGSGLGDLLPFLRRNGYKGKYLGVDFLDEFIEFSKKNILKIKTPNLLKLIF